MEATSVLVDVLLPVLEEPVLVEPVLVEPVLVEPELEEPEEIILPTPEVTV